MAWMWTRLFSFYTFLTAAFASMDLPLCYYHTDQRSVLRLLSLMTVVMGGKNTDAPVLCQATYFLFLLCRGV